MSFNVGDRVVYPHHGAAIVEKKEVKEVFGEQKEYLVLRMAHGEMTVSVPSDKAEEVGMRWPISASDRASRRSVLANRPRARVKSRAWDGLTRARATPRPSSARVSPKFTVRVRL